jgi:hypothetical protein
MSAAELQDEVRQVFPEAHWAEYEALLMKKKSQAGLTPEKQQRLEVLRREADVLSFRKSYAAVLLRRRGYEVPTPSALPQP